MSTLFRICSWQALVQLELKRLSEGKPSLLEDPSALPDLELHGQSQDGAAAGNSGSRQSTPGKKAGWWSKMTSGVKRAFKRDDKEGGDGEPQFKDFEVRVG